jgi:hypothetical protein
MAGEVTTLERASALTFPIALANGQSVATVGDAVKLFETLTLVQRDANHWRIAIRMMDHAIREASYLKTATLSLQTALAMDGLLDHLNESPMPIAGED